MKPKLPLTITALAITLLATYTAYTTLRLDLTFTNAKTEVSFWGRGNYQPTDKTRAKTGAQVDTLLASIPCWQKHPPIQSTCAWPPTAPPGRLFGLKSQTGARR
jgi:hypothetical protein